MPSLRRILGFAFIALVVFIVGTVCFFELQTIHQLNDTITEREQLLKWKQEAVQNYKEMVDFYKTREGIEHLARERYNLAFPGERVIIIVSEDLPLTFR